MKYKEGDRVKVVSGYRIMHNIPLGSIVTIQSIDSNSYKVVGPNSEGYMTHQFLTEYELSAIEEPVDNNSLYPIDELFEKKLRRS